MGFSAASTLTRRRGLADDAAMLSKARTLATTALVLSSSLASGCYSNEVSAFPTGYEPWETNLAPMPVALEDDPCPETVEWIETTYTGTRANGTHYTANSIHGRGCIHAPLAEVWAAIQDPLTSKEPDAVNSWEVIDPPMEGECDGDYEIQINGGDDPFTVDFRTCWRSAVTDGTDAAPLVTATRWQKVWGTAAIPTMEGSLIARPLEGYEDSISVLEYQYHLNAPTTDHSTMERTLGVFFERIGDYVHGRPLED